MAADAINEIGLVVPMHNVCANPLADASRDDRRSKGMEGRKHEQSNHLQFEISCLLGD